MEVTLKTNDLADLYQMNNLKTTKNIIPGDPTHPGEFIKEEIEYRKLSQKEVAHDMKISRSYLNEILN